jgi:hypothetical protein
MVVRPDPASRVHQWFAGANLHHRKVNADSWRHAEALTYTPLETAKEKFTRLANKWSLETAHVSSVTDLINDPSYQQIIALGMPVVPYLLDDLDHNKRFWFPALAAITGLRPFDPRDQGSFSLMARAWVRWGRRKGLI